MGSLVNPSFKGVLLQSTGYTTLPTGKRLPTYRVFVGKISIQSSTGRDIQRLENLGIQAVSRSVYLYGDWVGMVRADKKGGDVLQFPQAPGQPMQTWKVVAVAETWPNWCRVIVTLQTS
jgi:hypothetical protein